MQHQNYVFNGDREACLRIASGKIHYSNAYKDENGQTWLGAPWTKPYQVDEALYRIVVRPKVARS